jgi:hypothetical protein
MDGPMAKKPLWVSKRSPKLTLSKPPAPVRKKRG